MARQLLTLQLEEITAGDYLQWVRDPEPPALDAGLLSVAVEAEPLGDRLSATLEWRGSAPPAQRAALAAGFPFTTVLDPPLGGRPAARAGGRDCPPPVLGGSCPSPSQESELPPRRWSRS